MAACTFFGHRDCPQTVRGELYAQMERLVGQGVDTFYVGNQGQFDAMVYGCLKELDRVYPHIRYWVVLAYLPTPEQGFRDASDTLYPEGMELTPPKFAIDRRNRWMLKEADICLCCIHHTWGGAYKYVRMAKHQGNQVINLGSAKLDL